MNRITQKWYIAEYKTKVYSILIMVVALLIAVVFLFSHIRFYQTGADIAALTQRVSDAVTVYNGGIISIIETCPPFQWMGTLPNITIHETELSNQRGGAYIVTGTIEGICFRLIQNGFIFDTSYGGTTLISKEKACYLYQNDRTLIAQIEDLGGNEND